jgi:hypothetical protein
MLRVMKVIRAVVSVVVSVVVRVVMKDVVVKHINRIGWEKHITTCIRIGNEGHVNEYVNDAQHKQESNHSSATDVFA